MMRITQRAVTLNGLQGLNSNLAALTKLQNQLTAGTTISKPSDSPTGTNTSMITRAAIAGTDQYSRNISDGTTFLDATDTALQDMLSQVRRVRDLTVQALNDGAASDETQFAIATEVSGMRESMLGQANQVVQGRPIFGGVTSGTKAYNDDGSYAGIGGANGIDVQPLTRRVSDVETIRVDLTGPEAFGDPASGKDLFSVVENIAANVGDPTALAGDLADLDEVYNGLLGAAADVGTRATRMQTAASVNQSQSLTLETQRAATEDVDLPKTIMEMQMQQTSYQAALQVTAQILQPTLLDFLR
jgi:flagellar hook-associated protein 3 FlgL